MLELSGVTKRFGERLALDDVSFQVAPGRLTGFVGGNGAGKTTTMRIILGLLSRDGGEVTLDGAPLGPDARRTFGYMPEERGLYAKMKVLEQITYLARLHGFDKRGATRRAEEILDRLGLGERLNDDVQDLSLGNQQRAQIAAALVHGPKVLILDEPFSGLDPMAVETVLQVLQEHASAGSSVLFSSHQLDVVERLCDDLVIIAGGSVAARGTREQLRDEHSPDRYEIATEGDAGWLREEPGVVVVDFSAGQAVFEVDAPETAQRVLRRASDLAPVTAFGRQRPSLAQIFQEVVR
ncbi:ABC transporter ATP-binding protein [Microbacterium sp. gxy059]|uniref:ABC transporter ATP-binding protein n=1 Tax=Microbacterium sp. gxy059 TaxID=2957199 RepID=UPI003D98B850